MKLSELNKKVTEWASKSETATGCQKTCEPTQILTPHKTLQPGTRGFRRADGGPITDPLGPGAVFLQDTMNGVKFMTITDDGRIVPLEDWCDYRNRYD